MGGEAGEAGESVAADDRFSRSLLVVAILVPALLAASRALPDPDAAHDAGVVRVVGLGWAGGLRAFDALASAPFLALPVGTRAFRAALAASAATGLSGGLLFTMTRALLLCRAATPRLGAVLACVASLATTLSIAWQLESSVAAGSSIGALLGLLPIALASSGSRRALVALGLASAFAYEPAIGVAAAAGVAVAALGVPLPVLDRAERARIVLAFVAGLLPLAVPFARRRASTIELGARPFASWLGEGPLGPSTVSLSSPLGFFHAELGWLAMALAGVGLVLAVSSPRTRRLASMFAAVGVASSLAVSMGAPASASHFGASALLAIAALYTLSAVAMHALVVAIRQTNVSFAGASAAMVVVLETAFAAVALDDSSAACEARAHALYPGFDDALLATAPPSTVFLVHSPLIARHLMAARALGSLRADVALVPTLDLAGRSALRELSLEAGLAPFFRDMALAGAPTEFALASLATTRSVAIDYDATWDRTLARHLVPVGALDRFEPEPRGVSDRRKALDAFLPSRETLARTLPSPRDPVLSSVVGSLLRARVLALTAAGDRDLVPRAVDDLRAFEPADPVASEIVRRLVTTKGPIDVKDLAR